MNKQQNKPIKNIQDVIKNIQDIPKVFASNGELPEFDWDSMKVDYQKNPETFRHLKNATLRSKRFWRDTAFGRTLSGRNKAGRIVRRIGVVALSVGGGLLGVDVAGVVDTGQDVSQLVQFIAILERVAWVIAGIIGTLAGGTDYIEIKGEKYDEQEVLEGRVPTMRKLKQKILNHKS
jgi:hypothetical protein